ncbi:MULTISPECIES: hypothetical protein [unclassified Hydrogenophaga]|jgi:hypothetical protein|uniref:hypothetical protein n=1 Tax=unclassified Hydrogenophaga TaxID=2610897 RepID=UPI00131FA518|nr:MULTISPECIES: hypothetical protein [unclassified Hydrogenophaga]MDP3351715.1 hypothetical protein [Hydrogenophaga sp.]QHE78791.1 hypothetical protein F9Z45_21950 [Hydrogenophaga sp. PBL-H3]QHE83216.1 hypothetical protein F9Z44_21950 [Hydrogenophaga sp. PBL-H3]
MGHNELTVPLATGLTTGAMIYVFDTQSGACHASMDGEMMLMKASAHHVENRCDVLMPAPGEWPARITETMHPDMELFSLAARQISASQVYADVYTASGALRGHWMVMAYHHQDQPILLRVAYLAHPQARLEKVQLQDWANVLLRHDLYESGSRCTRLNRETLLLAHNMR